MAPRTVLSRSAATASAMPRTVLSRSAAMASATARLVLSRSVAMASAMARLVLSRSVATASATARLVLSRSVATASATARLVLSRSVAMASAMARSFALSCSRRQRQRIASFMPTRPRSVSPAAASHALHPATPAMPAPVSARPPKSPIALKLTSHFPAKERMWRLRPVRARRVVAIGCDGFCDGASGMERTDFLVVPCVSSM